MPAAQTRPACLPSARALRPAGARWAEVTAPPNPDRVCSSCGPGICEDVQNRPSWGKLVVQVAPGVLSHRLRPHPEFLSGPITILS